MSEVAKKRFTDMWHEGEGLLFFGKSLTGGTSVPGPPVDVGTRLQARSSRPEPSHVRLMNGTYTPNIPLKSYPPTYVFSTSSYFQFS